MRKADAFLDFAGKFPHKMGCRYLLSRMRVTVFCVALGVMIFTVLNWLGHLFLRSVGSAF